MDVSVVVASYNASQTIEDCLQALAAQNTRYSYEVIVADSSTDATADIIAAKYPWVRLLHSERRMYPGMARNWGIAAATGRIIAITDADCIPALDWLELLVRAHDSNHDVVGGSLVFNPEDTPTQLAYFFSEFNHWLPNGSARCIQDQPGANLSFKRKLLDDNGLFPALGYCSDTDYNYVLRKRGYKIWFDPAIKVLHQNPRQTYWIFRHQFEHGRAFGRWRVKRLQWSAFRRAFYLTMLPAVFCKIVAQKTAQALALKSSRKLMARCWPIFVMDLACWSLGESMAYLLAKPSKYEFQPKL